MPESITLYLNMICYAEFSRKLGGFNLCTAGKTRKGEKPAAEPAGIYMPQTGLPAEILLLFTVLIWALYFLIYLSSPENKVNQWACICGFLLSIGVFKEYLYYGEIFEGIQVIFFHVKYALDELINSILTAVLYYLAMPCVVIFSLYFCRADKRHPAFFRLVCMLLFIPVICFGMLYPWSQTREIPLSDPSAYTVVAIYNLSYGVLATAPIIVTLIRERKDSRLRQRRLVSLIALLPLWYWLATLFLVHLLRLESFYKLWQGNAAIILGLFLYYVRHLFRDGIWGMRLNRVHFDWTGEQAPMPENVRYVVHMLKNELAKQELCLASLKRMKIPEAGHELEIMDRSIDHIREFIRRSNSCTQPIDLNLSDVNVQGLLEEVIAETVHGWRGGIHIQVTDPNAVLRCDYDHMKEVLNNLVKNSLDAMGEDGKLTMSFQTPSKNIALIRVEDTGKGISEEQLVHIFDLYQSGYSDADHMGLGLYYCQNVIRAHGGYIQVKSCTQLSHRGTVFTLCIPSGRKSSLRQMEKKKYGNDQDTDSGE